VTKLALDPAALDARSVYRLFTGGIVPRPIGFISTVSGDGRFNAAPFSFFNGISHDPPMLCFSSARRADREKDTLRNVSEVGDFVANIVDDDLVAAMAACAEDYPREVSEFERAGLTPAPGRVVKSPTVAEAPISFECTVVQILPLPQSSYTLVIGQVVYFHVRDDLVLPGHRIDAAALRAVGRMAGNGYTRTHELFELESFLKV
jgi:flavin reductase (DIM6/NTAB) family NADH-FMN oxidoreductase RutF